MSLFKCRKQAWQAGFAAALLLVASAGCESSLDARVTGVVSLDGSPLRGGNVVFHGRNGTPGYGTIQPDGTYAISTTGQLGLNSGEYVVTVVSLGPPTLSSEGGMPSPGKHLIPVAYGSVSSTDLKFTITHGENKIDLALHSR